MRTRGARGGLRVFRTLHAPANAPQPRSRTRAGKPKNFLPFLCTAPPPPPPPKGEKKKGNFWFASPFENSTRGNKVFTLKPLAPYSKGDPRRNTMRSALGRRQICYVLAPPAQCAHNPAPPACGKVIKQPGH